MSVVGSDTFIFLRSGVPIVDLSWHTILGIARILALNRPARYFSDTFERNHVPTEVWFLNDSDTIVKLFFSSEHKKH